MRRSVHETDRQITRYALCRLEKANEEMAHAYSISSRSRLQCYGFSRCTAPWARPDMALFKFSAALFGGIHRYLQSWKMTRISLTSEISSKRCPGSPAKRRHRSRGERRSWRETAFRPWRPGALSISGTRRPSPHGFRRRHRGRDRMRAKCNFMDMRKATFRHFRRHRAALAYNGFRPKTPLKDGVKSFVAWYQEYFGV